MAYQNSPQESTDIYDTDWGSFATSRHARARSLVESACGREFSEDFLPRIPSYFVNAIIAQSNNPNMVLEIWDLFLESNIHVIPNVKQVVRDIIQGIKKLPVVSTTAQ